MNNFSIKKVYDYQMISLLVFQKLGIYDWHEVHFVLFNPVGIRWSTRYRFEFEDSKDLLYVQVDGLQGKSHSGSRLELVLAALGTKSTAAKKRWWKNIFGVANFSSTKRQAANKDRWATRACALCTFVTWKMCKDPCVIRVRCLSLETIHRQRELGKENDEESQWMRSWLRRATSRSLIVFSLVGEITESCDHRVATTPPHTSNIKSS